MPIKSGYICINFWPNPSYPTGTKSPYQGDGQCRAHPPKPFPGLAPQWDFPIVTKDWWCGEYSAPPPTAEEIMRELAVSDLFNQTFGSKRE